MVAQVVLQVMLVLSDEGTFGTLQHFVLLDVDPRMLPELHLWTKRGHGRSPGQGQRSKVTHLVLAGKVALAALEDLGAIGRPFAFPLGGLVAGEAVRGIFAVEVLDVTFQSALRA